jgi:carbon monoxide dehydrogenase subunit G
MEINDSFRVSTPIEDTWKVLLDIERIAPCLPGAELQEVEGDEYRGVVKVKVGPITAQYKGRALLAEVDEANRKLVIDAAGRDTRGQGNAKATIVVQMAADGDGTLVDVATDLSITGKVAQFGRGVLADVSSKLMGQFVENLERDVINDATQPAAASADVDADAAPATAAGAELGTGPRRIESRPAEPVDLLATAGAPVTKRLVPIALGALALFVVWRILRRGSRSA